MSYKHLFFNIFDFTKNDLIDVSCNSIPYLYEKQDMDNNLDNKDQETTCLFDYSIFNKKNICDVSIIIHLSFHEPIFKNIRKINFNILEETNYYYLSYIQYIYNVKIDNIIYTFLGFYKDGYLIIIINSYDETTKVEIKHKEVILLKIDWKLLEDNKKNKYYHISNFQKKNIRYTVLNIRNKISIENYFTIHDYLCITPFKTDFVNIYFS
jgi:hypothetical protein